MAVFALLAIVIIVIYGLTTAYGSYNLYKAGKIEAWPAMGMFASALALIKAGFFLGDSSSFTLPLLVISLLALHVLAIVNGLHMSGNFSWRHHWVRGILSLALIGLAYLALG